MPYLPDRFLQPDPREASLPQWIRTVLAALRTEVKAVRSQMDEDPNGRFLVADTLASVRRRLGSHLSAEFELGEGRRERTRIRVCISQQDPHVLELNAGASISFEASATNTLFVRFRP